jgi:hypothetical protein
MTRADKRKTTVFTVEQANATLPLVRAIVGDLVRLGSEVYERRRRLAALLEGRSIDENDPYHEELVQIERELAKDNRQLREYAGELRQLGILPKGSTEGWVDFPAVIDGRDAYLCWHCDDPEVLHWHKRRADHRRRQPLVAESFAGGDAIGDEQRGEL